MHRLIRKAGISSLKVAILNVIHKICFILHSELSGASGLGKWALYEAHSHQQANLKCSIKKNR